MKTLHLAACLLRLLTPRAIVRNTVASAAAEMALVFPILGYVFMNVADVGIFTYSKMQTELAAQEAVGTVRNLCSTSAKLPATNPAGHCSGTLTTQMTSAAQSTTLGTGVTLGVPVEGYYCATSTGSLTLVAAITGTPPVDCSAVVAGSTSAPGDYISVTASYSYTAVFPGLSIMSFLSTTITQTAWLRLQ